MGARPGKKRRPPGRTHDKLAITVPHTTAERAREAAKALGMPSLSAYISRTLEEKLEERTFEQMLDEIFSEKPMTDDERAWAEKILDP